jgi:hypothetical protein
VLGPENFLRKSDVFLVMASVEIKEGLNHPEVKKALNRLPKTLQKQIEEIVRSERLVFEKMLAIRELAIPYVNKPDPKNVLSCFPERNLRLVPPPEDDESDNTSQKHQKTEYLPEGKPTNKPNLRIWRPIKFSDDPE